MRTKPRTMADVNGCAPLHRLAASEREVYGEIRSGEALDHDAVCDADQHAPPTYRPPDTYAAIYSFAMGVGSFWATAAVACVVAVLAILCIGLPVGFLLVMLGLV